MNILNDILNIHIYLCIYFFTGFTDSGKACIIFLCFQLKVVELQNNS